MTNTNRAKEKTPAVQAGQTHAAPIRNAGGMGEEMGHFGCTGYSLDTPARTAAITALVQAMQASVYARSSICGLLGWGGEFLRFVSDLLVSKRDQLCCGLCSAGNIARFPT